MGKVNQFYQDERVEQTNEAIAFTLMEVQVRAANLANAQSPSLFPAPSAWTISRPKKLLLHQLCNSCSMNIEDNLS